MIPGFPKPPIFEPAGACLPWVTGSPAFSLPPFQFFSEVLALPREPWHTAGHREYF